MTIPNLPESMDAAKYYLGRLCIHGHNWEDLEKSLRRVSDRHCVLCEKKRQSSIYYRQQDNERERQRRLVVQALRPPKIPLTEEQLKERARECSKRWLERNREKARQSTRDWYKKNRVEPYTPEQLSKRYSEVFGGACAYCGCTNSKLTDDHFIPLFLGGCDALFNLVPACESCNSSKWANPPEYWYKRQAFFLLERWTRLIEATNYPQELERLGQQLLLSPAPRSRRP